MNLKQMKKLNLLLTLLLLCAMLTGCGGGQPAQSLDELLSLGQKYLQDENYEEAVVAFEKAIKLDDKCVEAYIGLADAYVGTGDIDKALAVLESGYEKTGDESLNEKAAEIENISQTTQTGKSDNSESGKKKGSVYAITDSELINKIRSMEEYQYLLKSQSEMESILGSYTPESTFEDESGGGSIGRHANSKIQFGYANASGGTKLYAWWIDSLQDLYPEVKDGYIQLSLDDFTIFESEGGYAACAGLEDLTIDISTCDKNGKVPIDSGMQISTSKSVEDY